MTMIDRGKVIKGLECCQTMLHDRGFENPDCRVCPYNNDPDGKKSEINGVYCVAELADDALALLKAQEPRVMTLVEARDALHNTDVIWFEAREDDRVYCGVRIDKEDYFVLQNDEWLYVTDFETGDQAVDYGNLFRCWTSRPTDKQREAVPWDD